MAAQWPRIVARLVTYLPTLSGWSVTDGVTVFNGAAVDCATRSFVTIGHWTDGIDTSRGSYAKTQHPDGYRYAETGAVHCQIASSDGLIVLDAVGVATFALMDALEDAIRANRTLGVLSAEGYFDLSVDVTSMQDVPGAGQTLPFTLTYFTVT